MAQVVVQREELDFERERENLGSESYNNVEQRFSDLFAYETVGRWLRHRQPRTKGEYLVLFEKFFRWARDQEDIENPDQLLQWAKAHDGIEVQDLIDKYTEGKKVSSAQINTALLRSFLGRNGYRSLPKIDWASTMNFTEGYKREEIQKLLGYLDGQFQKLYVLAAKDSGLRANDLLYMRYKHISEDLESGKEFVSIRFEKERYLRRKAASRTFLGPDSLTLLKQLVKEGKVSTKPEAKIFHFSYRTITGSLNWAKKQAGLRENIQPNHGLRKFFENQLDRTGMDVDKKRQLEGHSSGVKNAYTSRAVDELRSLYESAYVYLDLSEKAAVSSEVGQLQEQVVEQRQYIEALKEQLSKNDAEIPQLKARLEKMEKQFREKLA